MSGPPLAACQSLVSEVTKLDPGGYLGGVPSRLARFLPQDTPEANDLLISYGRAMMAWNTAEGALRTFLDVLIEEDGGAGRATVLALSADASSNGLEVAVRALAKCVLTGERLDDAKEVCSRFSLLRGYRNHYAHGLSHIVSYRGATLAPILSWTAKGGIKQARDEVTAHDLDLFSRRAAELSCFVMDLVDWWYPVALPGFRPARPERPPIVAPIDKVTKDLLAYAPTPRPKLRTKSRR